MEATHSDAGIDIYFSDFFGVDPQIIEQYGAFDVSLVADLPLFIDPFLIFNSNKPEYQALHAGMIKYLAFLRDKVATGPLPAGLIDGLFRFSEIRNNWLGFTRSGNSGRGLGRKFARSLHENLNRLFADFWRETITQSSHIEKLGLISDGVGRNTISDFTTNLIHEFLLNYTERFAVTHVAPQFRARVAINRVRFNYDTETWESSVYELPIFQGRHVLLTPADILTRDDTWISKPDLFRQFDLLPEALPDAQLREAVNNYFRKVLPRKPKESERHKAIQETLREFPQLIDYYIREKEEHGDEAQTLSAREVRRSREMFNQNAGHFSVLLAMSTGFYAMPGNTHDEAMARVLFMKNVIENKGGHRYFYVNGEPLAREEDLQTMYRLTWFATPSDVSREVNDGRGPADFKISRGAHDKTLVEFKLARNSQLKRNPKNQSPIYERASDTPADSTIKVIIYFSELEYFRVMRVLEDLRLTDHPNVVLIDARADNKPAGSKA
jgi:hypothetical protein